MKIVSRKFLDIKTSTCHASTVTFYHNKLIFAWFGGTREGAVDSSIYIQYDDKVFKMEHADQLPRWNPILFSHKDQLYLFVKLGIFCDRWQTLIYNISDILDVDFNITKVKFQILPAGLNGPVKTKPVVDDKGVIHCGSSVETVMDWTSYIEGYKIKKGEFIFQYRSDPLTIPKITYDDPIYGGKRQTSGIIQPSLWFDGKEMPHAFFRSSRGLGKIYHSVRERGVWADPIPTNLDNPNSGLDTVYYGKNLYLVYNPSSINRYPLVIKQLKDNFKTIDELTVTSAEDMIATDGYSRELSYPYMIENDDKLYLTYTFRRSKIEFVTIEI